MNRLDVTCQYALMWTGALYTWGGGGPTYDCSGFVLELLKASGVLRVSTDMNAQAMFEYLKPQSQMNVLSRGAVAFYGQATNAISHVAFMLNDEQVIEAGGGGRTTLSIEDARKQHAFVRIRLVKDPLGVCGRRDFVASLLPNYQ